MNLQVDHEAQGADDGAQVMQLTQVQLAHIVNRVASQALTQQMQKIGSNPPPATAAVLVLQNTSSVQQVQSPIKFDAPAFEIIVQQPDWRGVRELCTRLERVDLRLN